MGRRRLIKQGNNILNKKGGYILEAAVTLPVFLIAVMVLCSIILMYACIEDCNYIAANELRRGSAEAIYADTSVLVPYRLRKEALDDHSMVRSARITDFGYRTSRWGKDELIAVTCRLRMSSSGQFGLISSADYDISLVTRTYVGETRNSENMSESEMSGEDAVPVFIFPKRGKKYHSRGCGFLTADYRSASLTPAIRSQYSSCPLCGSRKAGGGAHVFYFPAAGEAYHLPGCPALQRNYIETDRKDAIARGYTPCAKCGG